MFSGGWIVVEAIASAFSTRNGPHRGARSLLGRAGSGGSAQGWRGYAASDRGCGGGQATSLADCDLMNQIRDYNEIDCQTLTEILQYLRTSH